jgi:glucose-6-phosphate 1-dehydrogenase
MRIKDPITFIIFGATGDLAKRKILPALMDLYCKDLLPDEFHIVGFSRKDLSDSDYREFVQNSLDKKEHNHSTEKIKEFLNRITYKQGDILAVSTYKDLSQYLSEIDTKCNCCHNKLYYLAVPPNLYESVFQNIYDSGLHIPCTIPGKENWTRVLVEKPFGSDSVEAKKLDKLLGKLFIEDQIFRIDHYLAKEAVQNILIFRFANAIFEPLWNRKYIEKVEIRLYEKNDADERANFYDGIGALRDVGQNHLMQMLALIAMEDPKSTKSDAIRSARKKVLSDIKLFDKDISKTAYRAQYVGYQDNLGLEKSNTETYFKLKLLINNNRWKGVPFYLESGKALNNNRVEIKITFKDKDSAVCVIDDICHYNNTLNIEISPEQKISLCFWTKKGGLDFELEQKKLAFEFNDNGMQLDAYEKVLYDAVAGDQTLFNSTEEVATQWGIIVKILEAWKNLPLNKYEKGSDPKDFNSLE